MSAKPGEETAGGAELSRDEERFALRKTRDLIVIPLDLSAAVSPVESPLLGSLARPVLSSLGSCWGCLSAAAAIS